MNKNSLSQLNKLYVERCRQLTVQNQELQLKNDALQKAINERNEMIEKLLADLEKRNTIAFDVPPVFEQSSLDDSFEDENVETALIETVDKTPEIKMTESSVDIPDLPLLDSISEYAAKAISMMVISSAKHSNIITSSSYENKKDLLNLIIGKCENAKYEISDILQSENSDAQKAKMIDACVNDAIEYFGCVIEQK